eukprot:scaffold39787_cov65-Phaeocystis_antarctica.AAC.3
MHLVSSNTYGRPKEGEAELERRLLHVECPNAAPRLHHLAAEVEQHRAPRRHPREDAEAARYDRRDLDREREAGEVRVQLVSVVYGPRGRLRRQVVSSELEVVPLQRRQHRADAADRLDVGRAHLQTQPSATVQHVRRHSCAQSSQGLQPFMCRIGWRRPRARWRRG